MSISLRLFGVPTRIQPWFLLTALILWPRELPAETLPVWIAIVLSGVVAHELGHALVGRRFGLEPSIELTAFAGLTSFRNAGLRMTPLQSILVSFAGPAVGLLLAAPAVSAYVVAPPETGSLPHTALWMFIAVNGGWAALNLIPVLPLDGGQIVASALQAIDRKRGLRWARYGSLVLIAALIAMTIAAGLPLMAMFLAFFAFLNFQALRVERELERRGGVVISSPEDLRDHAHAALEAGDDERLLRAAALMLQHAPDAERRDEALHLLAWGHLLGGNASSARSALDELSGERDPDPALEGAVQLDLGRHEEALDHLERALGESGPSAFVERRYLQAARRLGGQALERARDFVAAHPDAFSEEAAGVLA